MTTLWNVFVSQHETGHESLRPDGEYVPRILFVGESSLK